MRPDTKYAKSGSLSIAYQVFGDGPEDVVLIPGWVSNIDLFWDEPVVARFLSDLSGVCRVLLFDKRGTGLSDPIPGASTLEDRMDDVRAVMDAVGSERAILLGYSEGGAMSILFAATYPERTRALVLCGSYACRLSRPDFEIGLPEADADALVDMVQKVWGTSADMDDRIPSMVDNARFRNWWARFLRGSASPATAMSLLRMNFGIDVRPLLPAVRVPTLVLHSERDRIVDLRHGQYLAKNVPGAHLVTFDADDHVPFTETSDHVVAAIQRFVSGRRENARGDRILGTIMFTDIVGSTDLAGQMGDRAWNDLLDAHDREIAMALDIHRGRRIKSTGDGALALFDGPARAIHCARMIRQSLQGLGLDARVGIHTGECLLSDDDVSGIAVHIAARIAGSAGAGEVLVSQTVRDLVAGSGLHFDDRGPQMLKGLDESWSICEVIDR